MKLLSLLPFLALVGGVASQEAQLTFKKDGSYKILQVADLHYCDGAPDPCGAVAPEEKPFCTGLNTTAFYKRVLELEDPDFIVFTGDQIDGCATNPRRGIVEAVLPAVESGKPWAAILGNHDGENKISRRQVIEVLASLPGSLTRVGPADVEDPSSLGRNSNGNYLIRLVSPKKKLLLADAAEAQEEASGAADELGWPWKKKGEVEVPLWFLDSGSTHQEYEQVKGEKHVGGYDWVRPQQISWMQLADMKLRQRAREEKRSVRPSLAFFHIPVLEYDALLRDTEHSKSVVGNHQENICSAQVNSGLYSTLVTTGVAAAFVGHDHTNDYCGKYVGGVQLCYGGGVGYHTYGKVGFARRVRVINIDKFGKRATSWKRLDTPDLRIEDRQTLYDADSALASERPPLSAMGRDDSDADASAESAEGLSAPVAWDEKWVPQYARENEMTHLHTLRGKPLGATQQQPTVQ